jgi:uncharacterized protein (DUF433 family)
MHEAIQSFPNIVIYRFPGGAEARLRGTRLSVWRIAEAVRDFGGVEAAARHYEVPASLLAEAIEYAETHSEEIERDAAANRSITVEKLRGELPGLEVLDVPGHGS